MPRGGKRPGAGRPSGVKSRIDAAKATVAAHAESLPDEIRPEIKSMSPLQVMLRAMAIEANNGKWASAAMHARDAAPYCHARLSNVEMNATVRRSATDFADAELAALLAGDEGEGDGASGDGKASGRAH